MQYSQKVFDYIQNPRNVGALPDDAPDVGTAMMGNPVCGDVMKLQIRIKDNTIVDAKFKTFGCGAAIASASYLTELIIGKPVDEATKITNEKIFQDLGLPPIKVHCSILAADALKSALADYNKKNLKE
jgi:nitrogen fixation NifU-like protein